MWFIKKNHQVCNGCEFLDFDLLEKSIHSDINKRMEIHYTETYASYQKLHIENNHILLRWLIHKGYDITLLSADGQTIY